MYLIILSYLPLGGRGSSRRLNARSDRRYLAAVAISAVKTPMRLTENRLLALTKALFLRSSPRV